MADVKVRIIAVDEASEPLKKAGQEVENVGKKAKESGGAFEGFGKTMASVAGGLGLQMGLSAIVGGLKNAVVGSFELAAALEQTKVGFTTMLGSGEAAQGMLDDLRSFAAKTPFQFQDLTVAASRMIAMGTAAEDVIPTLTAVGDAAAGLGLGKAGIDRITLALGQMGAKGKIGGDDLRQLAEAGVPALRYLADAAGVTTAEMSKMIEKGIVPAEQGVKVLVQSMSNDFGGLMAEQAKTASGSLSNLEDAAATLATAFGNKLLPVVAPVATGLADMANSMVEAMSAAEANAQMVDTLAEALRRGAIDEDKFNELVDDGRIVSERNAYQGKVTTETVINMGAATLVAAEAQAKYIYESDRAADSTNENYTAIDKLVPKVDEAKDAILQLKEAARLQAESFSTLSGASKEYDTDTTNLGKKHTQLDDDIAKLTKSYQGNHAAILAGKGTVVDNTREIEAASIAAARSEISFGKLNERFANQDNINKYNDGVSDLNAQQDKLNTSFKDGKIDGDKLAEELAKISDKNNDLKDRLHDSQMSTDDFNLSVRQHNIDVANGSDKMALLVSKHGEGKTAAELAAGATATYNTQLAGMKTKLEEVVLAEAALQTQTALRIKEGMILDLIKDAADGGLQEEEVRRIQGVQTAMGLQDDATITGMLAVQRGSTLLAEFRDTHAKEFEAGNVATAKSFGAAADYIGNKTDNVIIPTLAGMTESIKKVNTPFFELKAGWDGLNSKDVELRITTIRTELIQTVQAAKFGGAGPAMGAPLAGTRAGGGAVMGGAGAYLVGEAGPELFNPAGTGGSITPNGALGRGGLAIGTLNVYGVQSTSELFNQLSKEARARGMQFAVN